MYMSVFVEQTKTLCEFSNSDSWVILSEFEQNIKRKIESMGTPLKEWDIQINYGIKTGANDTFVISTERRNEILSNCLTEEERKRTEELIRPINIIPKTKRLHCNFQLGWFISRCIQHSQEDYWAFTKSHFPTWKCQCQLLS